MNQSMGVMDAYHMDKWGFSYCKRALQILGSFCNSMFFCGNESRTPHINQSHTLHINQPMGLMDDYHMHQWVFCIAKEPYRYRALFATVFLFGNESRTLHMNQSLGAIDDNHLDQWIFSFCKRALQIQGSFRNSVFFVETSHEPHIWVQLMTIIWISGILCFAQEPYKYRPLFATVRQVFFVTLSGRFYRVVRCGDLYMYIQMVYALCKCITNSVLYMKVLRIPHMYTYIMHIYTLRIPIIWIGVCFIRMRYELRIQSI